MQKKTELLFAICTLAYRAFAVACLLLVPALAILQWDRYMDGPSSSHRVAEYALIYMVFLFATPLLFARIALWALAVTLFIRARFYGFGDENMLSKVVVRTRATPFPKGFTSESYYRHLKLSQLGRHSLVYADSEVIAKTVESENRTNTQMV
jgi:hypothetical protein